MFRRFIKLNVFYLQKNIRINLNEEKILVIKLKQFYESVNYKEAYQVIETKCFINISKMKRKVSPH